MANDKIPKFKAPDGKGRVFIGLGVAVVLVVAVVAIFRSATSSEPVVQNSSVTEAPNVASVPGISTPSAEYVKAQELANAELAKQASKTTSGSAVPTITRKVLKEVEDVATEADGCDIESLRKAREAGVTAAELRCRGCSAAQLRTAGYTAAELRAAGFSAAELKASGFTAAELREAGFSAAELRAAGFSAAELRAAGFSAAELMAAGFSVEELLAAGFSAAELRTSGFGPAELLAAGSSPVDLKAAGFSASRVLAAGVSEKELLATGFSHDSINAAKALLAEGKGCDITSLKKAREDAVSLKEMKSWGCDAAALRAAGFTAAELREAGFSAAELKAAGFTAAELKAAGFSALELRDAGFTAAELRAAGFSATELREAGFSAAELRAAGFTAEELRAAGFTAEELRAAGFSEGELIRAGFASVDMSTSCDVSELKKEREAGASALDLKKRGCSVLGLAAAGVSAEELKGAGFDVEEIQTAESTTRIPEKKENMNLLDTGVPEVDPHITDPLERLRLEQTAQLIQAKREQQIQEIEGNMLTQATQLVSTWSPPAPQTMVEGDEKPKVEGAVQSVDLLPPSQVFKIKAGDIIYAVLSTEVNTDAKSHVMASVVSGPLKGSKLLGSFDLSGEEGAALTFTTISVPTVSASSTINAIAIDPETAETALASSVDHHYLLRYGSMFASSFLKGFAEAVASQGTVTTDGGRTERTLNIKSNRDRMYMGLGEAGSQYAKVMGNNFQKPTTVKVAKGTGFGLLFTSDTKIALADLDLK